MLSGRWAEIFNSDAAVYGGSNVGNGGGVEARRLSDTDARGIAELTLPPLGAIILRHEG